MGTATGMAPWVDKQTADTPAVGTAGNDATTTGVAKAKFKGAVTAVTYVPASIITGANTNTRKVDLVNKGQDGSGSTVIATLQFDSGVNAAAHDEKTIPLSVTVANRDVNQDDVLAWVSTHVGTGITDPGGEIFVEITRD